MMIGWRLARAMLASALLCLTHAASWAGQGDSGADGRTVLMAIGVCPPWKQMPHHVCTSDVTAVRDALAARLDIPQADIVTILNADATTANVRAAFSDLTGLGPDDRLIIYMNLHNGAAHAGGTASANDDVFVFWSVDNPRVIQFALAEGVWMRASDFADLVHGVGAGEIVMIVDACESDAVAPLFLHDHPANIPARRVGIATSAQPGQVANITADETMGLFSRAAADAITHGDGSLMASLGNAATVAQNAAIAICASRGSAMTDQGRSPEACNQVPTVHDPDNLLAEIVLR